MLDSGEPCFFAGEHARANKTIAENNPIGAVAQIGSTLFVAARHMLVAHSVLPRDLRSSFSQQHDQPITALTTCREHLVSASVNGDAFIWTVEGSQVAARPHPAAIWDLSSSEGMLATAGDDGVVRVYRDPIASDTHERFLLGVSHVLATTKNLIAAASRDRVIMVSWRGERKWDARAHIGTIAAHPHDDLFALGTSTGEVMLARPGGYREVSTGHCPSPSLAFSPRGDRLFIGSGTPAHPGAALELELS